MVEGMFHKGIGVYKSRMIEAVNPLYWLEVVLLLPKHALSLLGVPPESSLTRIVQLLYWAVVAISGIVFTLFQPEIRRVVAHLLGIQVP